MHFSSADSDVGDKPSFKWPSTAANLLKVNCWQDAFKKCDALCLEEFEEHYLLQVLFVKPGIEFIQVLFPMGPSKRSNQ